MNNNYGKKNLVKKKINISLNSRQTVLRTRLSLFWSWVYHQAGSSPKTWKNQCMIRERERTQNNQQLSALEDSEQTTTLCSGDFDCQNKSWLLWVHHQAGSSLRAQNLSMNRLRTINNSALEDSEWSIQCQRRSALVMGPPSSWQFTEGSESVHESMTLCSGGLWTTSNSLL